LEESFLWSGSVVGEVCQPACKISQRHRAIAIELSTGYGFEQTLLYHFGYRAVRSIVIKELFSHDSELFILTVYLYPNAAMYGTWAKV